VKIVQKTYGGLRGTGLGASFIDNEAAHETPKVP
jgi:hypothetical protein